MNKEGAAKETKEKRKEDAAGPHRGAIPATNEDPGVGFQGFTDAHVSHTLVQEQSSVK